MELSGKRVLVTGAGGFIGSHLVEHLIELGAQVTAFCRYNSRNSRGFLGPDVNVFFGDLRNPTFGMNLAPHQVIFHLGACISVPYSFDHPDETNDVNATGTLHVLQAARAYRSERVVLTSTSEVYGTAQYEPIDENHPRVAQSPYAASKIAADALGMAFYNVHQLPVTIVRPFNTYGPRQSDRAILPTLISQVLNRDVVKVGNLDSRRDMTYVSDTVRGMIRAACCDEAVGQELNLGTGHAWSIGDMLSSVMETIGKHPKVEVDPERVRSGNSEVKALRSNNCKAQTLLGWSPRVALAVGISRTIEFIKAHPELYSPTEYRV